MSNRIQEIHAKGFDISTPRSIPVDGNVIPADYSKIKVGVKQLEDAVINVGQFKKINPRMTKENIQRAISRGDVEFMREASEFFFKVSGIYSKLCNHLSSFYRYDWYMTPHVLGTVNPEKVLQEFNRSSLYLERFHTKLFCTDVALKVIRQGCYYGYIIHDTDTAQVQELPPKYCRARYNVRGRPAVEFNMRFFDEQYKNADQRFRVLKLFPKEFQKGYLAYKDGQLVPDFPGDTSGWYLLDPECTVKFSINGEDYPPLISVIPHLIDLDQAQELDRKKMAQKLLKIIIQKMPLDKNGDLIFDVDEAQELHNNAVKMLGKAIGVDVLTTFADVDVADMADKNTATSIDELEKVERTVFNESGTAQNLFNTDGNIALEKSILNDEANMYELLLQFEAFLNYLIKPFNKNPKKMFNRVEMLPTTVYNYKEMSKLYKDQSNAGGSKQLANIALGQSQLSSLATAKFENEILDISSLFQSKAQKEEAELKRQSMVASQQSSAPDKDKEEVGNNGEKLEKKKPGRKEKPDDQKSEKTIKNREAMN